METEQNMLQGQMDVQADTVLLSASMPLDWSRQRDDRITGGRNNLNVPFLQEAIFLSLHHWISASILIS